MIYGPETAEELERDRDCWKAIAEVNADERDRARAVLREVEFCITPRPPRGACGQQALNNICPVCGWDTHREDCRLFTALGIAAYSDVVKP